ncbi:MULTISPECIES: daptide-type RiPP biosynthesis methyltransferase [Amycolatopsis]|uniref:Methyltransferase domain-containing protein n=2 Tax=Amycolatopsis TaxID=1813 RepID=A0A1I4DK14_9PSEU|nr:daptide-type RiPP biosynthesis methyltransferase [Amycolatopsis sacchari]SFK92366.1 Methyltransferase domain-containing protein [Amycolatopsis sacchari]
MIAPPGTAGRLAELYGLRPRPLYGPEGSAVYDAMCRHDATELPDVLRLAQGAPGPVLELACGSGRLTLPLAARGHEVVALDSSAPLLALLKSRIRDERIDVVECDMAEFAFDRSFGLIVLAASSVCLLDAGQRAETFRRIAAHLAPGGRCYVSVLDLAGELTTGPRPRERVTVLVDDATVLTLHQHFDGRRAVRTTSLFTEAVPDGARALFTSEVAMVGSAELARELAAAGMVVQDVHRGAPGEQVRVQLVCGLAGGGDDR